MMKRQVLSVVSLAAILLLLGAGRLMAQQSENWTPQQLMAPADLARIINNPKAAQPIVFSVGPMAVIKGSVDIGPTMMGENLAKLKSKLEKLPKNSSVVVYCGCCPFSRCPNVRPAVDLLKTMKFTNFKLLNLPQNIKVDWMDHGYPTID